MIRDVRVIEVLPSYHRIIESFATFEYEMHALMDVLYTMLKISANMQSL
jgi:hypothetical protein